MRVRPGGNRFRNSPEHRKPGLKDPFSTTTTPAESVTVTVQGVGWPLSASLIMPRSMASSSASQSICAPNSNRMDKAVTALIGKMTLRMRTSSNRLLFQHDFRAHPFVRENFQKHRMRNAAVDERNFFHARLQSSQRTVHFWNHAFVNNTGFL